MPYVHLKIRSKIQKVHIGLSGNSGSSLIAPERRCHILIVYLCNSAR